MPQPAIDNTPSPVWLKSCQWQPTTPIVGRLSMTLACSTVVRPDKVSPG